MNFTTKTNEELTYIQKDAFDAAKCAKAIGNVEAELRYLDEVNDASTELFKRAKKGI